MDELLGRVVVITGAGGGIGRATAVKLASHGMKLVLFGGNNLEKLDTTRALVEKQTECLVLPGNLTDTSLYDGMLHRVEERFGGADVLINNAGMAINCPYSETTEAQFDAIMNINVRVPYFLTQKLLPFLRKSSAATIINIASVVSYMGYAAQSSYAASKHALLGFTKSLAAEVYQEGIRVHAIAPGGVYTDMVKISRPDLTPEGMILPEEIAEIIEFLLLHRNNAVIDEILVHRVKKQPFLV